MNIVTKEISGIASAIRDMRNPMGSQSKSDSVIYIDSESDNLILESLGEKDEELLKKLGRAKPSSGHDCVLKSIVVHMDITATHDFLLQLYRYHFRDTTSSTSKMHSITKGDISDKCSSYVSRDTIKTVNHMIALYNTYNPTDTDIKEDSNVRDYCSEYYHMLTPPTNKKQLFECIIHNTPLGYELTVGEVTNYLQLKTMYKQRKNHKMSSWSVDFVDWVKGLPYSYLITGEDS